MNPELREKGFLLVSGLFANQEQLSSYESCIHDPFMGNGTRYKRFSQYKVAPGPVGWDAELLPSRPYTAYKKFNSVGGGFKRPYEPILTDFRNILLANVELLELDRSTTWQVNMHQNRSIADTTQKGLLTPEGRHQDGHEFVSISVFSRKGLSGGCSRTWSSVESAEPLLSHVMQPGETLLLDDRRVFHDVTDLEATSDSVGTRDILILAFSRWDDRWYGDQHDSLVLTEGVS